MLQELNKCLTQLEISNPELDPAVSLWIQQLLTDPLTKTEINFDNTHEIFRTLIPFTFLPDETAIRWGKFREFPLRSSGKTLILQPYSITGIPQSKIWQQTQIPTRVISPDPLLIGIDNQPLTPSEIYYYHRLVKMFNLGRLESAQPITKDNYHTRLHAAAAFLTKVTDAIHDVIGSQTKTIPLSIETKAFLLTPHYLKTAQVLTAPLQQFAQQQRFVFPQL